MAGQTKRFGMGWLPDYPDYRDYTVEHREVGPMLKKLGLSRPARGDLPKSVDLRQWCPPVEDQGELGACTAHAGVGLVEYFERRAFGKHIDASRLFLYKVTRNLLNWRGDTGAFLRSTMGAMVLFGVPPEQYWPYRIEEFDKEPPPFCYAFAQNYQAIKYLRLDPPDIPKGDLLAKIKAFLAAGVPAMFGFSVYSSISEVGSGGEIPFPCPGEKIVGGHAVMAVGY
ncbi:MAG: cysteine protease, partial [Deltaproteobacteria bacterium]